MASPDENTTVTPAPEAPKPAPDKPKKTTAPKAKKAAVKKPSEKKVNAKKPAAKPKKTAPKKAVKSKAKPAKKPAKKPAGKKAKAPKEGNYGKGNKFLTGKLYKLCLAKLPKKYRVDDKTLNVKAIAADCKIVPERCYLWFRKDFMTPESALLLIKASAGKIKREDCLPFLFHS